MFETMNDRGARLTAVDLLKSFLLSHVGSREDELNTRWQETLRRLATEREDPGAASRFIKAALLAHHARPGSADDRRGIETNLNVWVRQNAECLGLRSDRPERFLKFVGPGDTMTVVVEARQNLYLRLCEIIWSAGRLGLTVPPPPAVPEQPTASDEIAEAQPHVSAPTRGTRRRRTDVAKMIEAGVLKAGTAIVLTYRSVDHWATIDEEGGIVLKATGRSAYDRADEAGAAARGIKTCQGMNEWHVEDEQGVHVLRDQAQADGPLARTRQ